MIDALYIPPKPAIIVPRAAEIIRPGDPKFVVPMSVAMLGGLGVSALSGGGGAADAAVTTYRYWKFTCTSATHSGIIVSEMQLLIGGVDQIPAMSGATTSGVTISQSHRFDTSGTYDGWRVGDNNNSTGWDTGTPGLPVTLTVDFGAGNAKHIEGATIRNFSSGGSNYYSPTAYNWAGSNDNSSYTTIFSVSGLSWTNGETKTYTFSAY